MAWKREKAIVCPRNSIFSNCGLVASFLWGYKAQKNRKNTEEKIKLRQVRDQRSDKDRLHKQKIQTIYIICLFKLKDIKVSIA